MQLVALGAVVAAFARLTGGRRFESHWGKLFFSYDFRLAECSEKVNQLGWVNRKSIRTELVVMHSNSKEEFENLRIFWRHSGGS